MGCVRDHVAPEHFVKKIIDFRQETGATVYIVSYNQTSHRQIRQGLSHEQLLFN